MPSGSARSFQEWWEYPDEVPTDGFSLHLEENPKLFQGP